MTAEPVFAVLDPTLPAEPPHAPRHASETISTFAVDRPMHPPERPGLHCATCHGRNPGSMLGAMIEHARDHRRFRVRGGRYVARHRDHTHASLIRSLDRDEAYRQTITAPTP